MSSTTTTEFYGLTQYVGTDKPSFTDNNEAFRAVDGDLHEAVVGVRDQAEAISAIRATVANLGNTVVTLQNDLDTEKGKIVNLQNKETLQDAEIADVKADAQNMITAYVEATAESTHAYSVGDYFIYNDVLYKATDSIAIGATIVPDTNCTTDNVTTELIALNAALLGIINDASTSADVTWSADKINTELLTKLAASTLTMDGTNLDFAFADNKLKITYKLTDTVWVLIQLSGAPAIDGYKMAFYSTHDAGSTWDSYWTIPNA